METEMEQLKDSIRSIQLVDAHAHNLVSLDSKIPFVQAFSEAQSEALHFASETLSFKRSLRDLSSLYGVEASLESIQAHRKACGLEAVTARCFQATDTAVLLVDDGLSLDEMKPLDWHDQFFPQPVRRILRIEAVAETILKESPPGGHTWTLDSFHDRFVSQLTSLSENATGFKSIAAYRSGLDINPNVSDQEAEQGLMETIARAPLRISNKPLVSFIFTRALEVACRRDIPLQIHTGFGDKDLDLRLASPLHLRAVLEDARFTKSRLVLLHASYPFVRDASYLASVYPQVYLDFGLAIPKLSVRGMENTLSELLELAPIDKVMFSTDGVAFPETYYLGAKWTREVLAKVLYKAYVDGDLTFSECITAAEKILQKNALAFYKLEGVSADKPCVQTDGSSCPPAAAIKKMVYCDASPSKVKDRDVRHVRIMWGDGTGQRRCRVVPSERFAEFVVHHGVGLVECGMAMPTGIDMVAEGSGLSAIGEIRLMPDLKTKRRLPWSPGHEIVLGDMDVVPGTNWECCPRGTLRRVVSVLEKEFQLIVRAGFENEFYLLKPSNREPSGWVPIDPSSYCSTAAYDAASDIMDEIYNNLKLLNIEVEQMHAEAGDGQFELALNHYPALTAADNLTLVRETVKVTASKHLLLATFLPKYFANDIGSGSHVHLSIWQDGVNKLTADPSSDSTTGMSQVGEEFLAGVLHHLPAVLAFTAPHPNSYERLRPDTWSGASQCWGLDNREAALRVLSRGSVTNFELKPFDGLVNPHLGLAAIIAAGIDGLRKHLVLPPGIDVIPSTLPKGTIPQLPENLTQAADALEADDDLKSLLGEKLVKVICAIRRADVHSYGEKKPDLLDRLAYTF